MKNLDWKKINNGNDFQRLVNDLFALEINHPAFLSSNPEIGADGGWDGRYKGTFMNLDGVWSFQAKWTKHNLEEAYKQLHEEVKQELEKAKKNKVRYLLLATNADLRVGTDDHVGKLEKLNDGNKFVEHLFIWPRANLENRIIQYSLLRHSYFGDPQEPMFVPPHLFAESEPLLSKMLIGRENSLADLNKILEDTESSIYLVHSGGGYGKTHFIVEAGKSYSNLKPDTQVVFCRPGIRDVNEAINELNHTKNTIIFLDDAERYLDDARKLIAHTKTFSPGKLKVILSCRSSGKEIIKNLAATQRVDNLAVFELPQLPEKDLVEILNHAAGSKNVKHPERIVKELNGNLFLIVTTGKFIRGGEIKPGHVKEQIKNNLDHEAINALNGLLAEQDIKKLLKELSVIVPFPRDQHNNIMEKLSAVLNIDSVKLSEAVDRFKEAKILRSIGSSIRFNPDMKGDIYLSVELDKENGKELVNQIFENWLTVYPKQLTVNLAAASRHRETETAGEAVKDLITKWISEVQGTSNSLKSKRLELINPISFLAPEEIINLIYAYLDSSPETESIYGLSRDTYGPVIYHLLHISGFEEQILGLILSIAQLDLKGTYDNYKPINLLKQAISPIEVNINSANKSLLVLSNWVIQGSCTEIEAKLASEGVREALSGSHEYRESYGNQMTFGRRVLLYEGPSKETVDKFRDDGMKLLKGLIFHSNNKIKKIGIDIVSDIGHEAASTEGDFWERILLDKTQAVDWIKEVIPKTMSNEVLSAVEDVLIRYWANNNIYVDLSKEAAKILRKFPRSTEYIVFRYFVSHDLIISDFADIEKSAPKNERWSWLVHNHFRLRDFKQEDLDNVVKHLSENYKNSEEIIEYLKKLEKEVRGITQWQYIPLVETWAKFNEQVFIEILNKKSLFNEVPEMFHLGIYRIASDKDKKYISEYAEEILSNVENLQHHSVQNLLDLISRHDLSAKEFMPWLTKIIQKADGYIKNLVLHRSYFIFKDKEQAEKNRVIDILDISLNGVVDNLVLDMVDFLLHNATQWNLPKDGLNKIRTKLFEVIKDIPSIDYHTDTLIKFALGSDLTRFLELVDYRLKKQRGSFKKKLDARFDAVPFDGFRSMEELIKTYNDFSQLMDKVNFWLNEELMYSFEVDHFLKNIKGHDDEHGDYLLHYIDKKIKEGGVDNIKIAINGLFGVPFGDSTADLFLNLLLTSENAGILEEAKEVYAHQVLSGSYTSTVGQAPPALVNKKEALEKMRDKCSPGSIKNYIDSLIKSIDADIQRHLDEGEELNLPKS